MSPAVIFYLVEKLGRTPTSKYPKTLFEISVFCFALMVNLPASIAMFPQTGKMTINEVEMELRKDGVREVYYNKGLWKVDFIKLILKYILFNLILKNL